MDAALPPDARELYTKVGIDPDLGFVRGEALRRAGRGLVRYKHCGPHIVELELLPESLTNEDRCAPGVVGVPYRTDRARVARIYHALSGEPTAEVHSALKGEFVYRVGETAVATSFCGAAAEQCCPGIHYFLDMSSVYARMLYHRVLTLAQVRTIAPPGSRITMYDSTALETVVDTVL